MNEQELKLCPFCGSAPRVSSRASNDSDGRGKFVGFAVCYCGGYGACAHKMGFGDTPEHAESEVITLWNTRAPSTDVVIPIEVAQLKAKADLRQFVGALDAGITGLRYQIAIGKYFPEKVAELEQHLSQLQQLKAICEA